MVFSIVCRLRLDGTEAVLTLRSMIAKGQEYRRFHAARERERPYLGLNREMTVSGPDRRRHSKRAAPIVDRLNADPDKYPPPLPPGGAAKARGAWSKSAVCEVLRNPKYTGYQVFNRRARRSRSGAHNDPALWVWSPEPVHEPLIPKWMHDELAERRQAKRGSRDGHASNAHPQTRRTYVLRGMLLHACNRRMFGKHRDGITYYSCQPQANNRGRPDAYAGHPKTVYLREDAILEAISAFLSNRVFGPERRELLAAELASVDDRAARQRQTERDRLQRTLDGLSHRQENILRQAETGDPGDPFTKGLRESYNRLEAEREATLAELDAADAAEPARPTPEDADLLDGLPYLALNLVHAPEQLLRRLFEVIQLTIRLHYDPAEATISITLPAEMLPDIAYTAERMHDAMPTIARSQGPRPSVRRTDAVGAPGRTRTCGQALRRRLLYPLSYGGQVWWPVALMPGCGRIRDLAGDKDRAPLPWSPVLRLRGSMWRFGEAVLIIAGRCDSCIAFGVSRPWCCALVMPAPQSSLPPRVSDRRADVVICFRKPPKLGILRMW
ncbi:hypothetical protein GCM10023080_011220 [Streptomyces pseudoechinosporeus]